MPNRKYTVLLLYPDDQTEQYGGANYLAHVSARDAGEAQRLAMVQAGKANELNREQAGDLVVLFVCYGHMDDVQV